VLAATEGVLAAADGAAIPAACHRVLAGSNEELAVRLPCILFGVTQVNLVLGGRLICLVGHGTSPAWLMQLGFDVAERRLESPTICLQTGTKPLQRLTADLPGRNTNSPFGWSDTMRDVLLLAIASR
jgi:hypothetical protein